MNYQKNQSFQRFEHGFGSLFIFVKPIKKTRYDESQRGLKVEAAGIEPVSSETQWEKLERLTSATDPVAAYLQLLNDTHGHRLAQTELDLAFLLTRWPNLPQHIRQTIMTLVRSVGRVPEESVETFGT